MQFIANGFISGLAIALMALAWQLVYLPTRILFVAIAGIYAFAPYAVVGLAELGTPLLLAVAVAIAISASLGAACEAFNHRPLTRRGASETAHFVTSLGIYLVMVQALAMMWGAGTRTLRAGVEPVVQIGGVLLLQSQLTTALVCLLLTLGVLAAIVATPLGLRLRALADNPDALALLGYDVGRYRRVCFAAAAACAASVAILNAYATGFDPFLGLNSTLVALAAVLIGGRGSFVGPVIAAVGLGLLRALTVWATSPQWQDPITFGLLAILLISRPHGLATRRLRLENAG